MENYKGIYYKDTKEQKYYEGGAHFKYKTLFNVLLSLGGLLIDENQNHHLTNSEKKQHINSSKDINSHKSRRKAIKIQDKKYRSV